MDGKSIKTLSKLNEILLEIDTMLSGLNSFDIFELSQLGQEVLKKAKTTKQPDKYLQEIKENLVKIPIFEVTVAFSPTSREVNEIASYVSENIASDCVVDIQVNTYLVGGAQISFQGKYYDGSFVRKIENV